MMPSKTTFLTLFSTMAVALAAATTLVCGAGQARAQSSDKKRPQWKSAVLEVVTNFEKADVTVNGLEYPEYPDVGQPRGMVLPAGGPYTVQVSYDGNTKTYRLHLDAYETRLLMVDLTGFKGGNASPAPRRLTQRKAAKRKKQDEDKEEEQGRVTVYSKPKGDVLIDDKSQSERTPGTVQVEPGRHEVQVRFENGDESEKKIIRVREGSRIKLFFRQKSNK